MSRGPPRKCCSSLLSGRWEEGSRCSSFRSSRGQGGWQVRLFCFCNDGLRLAGACTIRGAGYVSSQVKCRYIEDFAALISWAQSQFVDTMDDARLLLPGNVHNI